jgi:hypothetical protein|tara:strand:+ start:5526 stop:5774 length:249 start_codon:yes stop_codon:yes gene_type:complete
MAKLAKVPDQLLKDAYTELKANTPIRSGNARNKTKVRGDKIRSNYSYAGSLDAGSSPQAPDGFTKPTIEYMRKDIDKLIKRI